MKVFSKTIIFFNGREVEGGREGGNVIMTVFYT